ncbi:MAG TPA: FtsX-like permease family protein [Steroidobacteraceae bacterium]|jgi:putative ABC transport system permease protein|nr:FtsX-like permease family protein [Steroidobacteraceae bacterium]
MDILPILRALMRNKTGALLIGLQIALTIAMLCNSLSIIEQLGQRMRQPAGIDEANIFVLSTAFVDDPPDLKARLLGDLAALRSLPGVIDADTAITLPLGGNSYGEGVSLKPDQRYPTAVGNLYFDTDHGLATYGLKLTAGRWFHADEVIDLRFYENRYPASIVVTQELARALFPAGNALGQQVWLTPTQSSRIIGVVATVAAPGGGKSQSMYLPEMPINKGATYVVRTKPGTQAAVMRAAQDRLFELANQRVIQNLVPFTEIRARTFQLDRVVSIVLTTVCALLLAVTACGIVGLTMYWVAQRRPQIGVRRALGARRIDVLAYFHTENLLIAGAGAVLGIGLGMAVNVQLAKNLELTRVSVAYVCAGALVVLVLCQAAVLWPALRAASIPPAVAARAQ